MKKNLFLASLAALTITIISSCGNEKSPVDEISWMIGKWEGTDVNTVIFHESWQREGKTGFVGFGCSLSPDGDTLFKENLKIDLVEGVPYYIVTIPPRKEPVLFKLIQGDAKNAIFENREHDFPQRISYILENNTTVNIKLEGIEKGEPKVETLRFVRAKGEKFNLNPGGADSTTDTSQPKPIKIQIQ